MTRPLPSRQAAQAVRRITDQQRAKLDAIPASRLFVATVTTVEAGASVDGRAVVTVSRRGADLPAAAYNRNQTFTVNDRVVCALVDDQLLILFALGGFPPEL